MSDSEYCVLFKGEIQDGHNLDEVKSRMAKMFKMEIAKIEHFFTGKTVVIKKKLTFETAEKYQQAINKAGGRCWIHDGLKNDENIPPTMTDQSAPEDRQATNNCDETEGEIEDQKASEQIAKAIPFDYRAIGETSVIPRNVFDALTILITDPIGGQNKSLMFFQKGKALSVGILFICFFMAAAFLVEWSYFNYLKEFASKFAGIEINTGDYVKLMLLTLVPPSSLFVSFWIISKIARGEYDLQSSYHAHVYTAGVVLIPSGITLLVFWFFGYGNIEFVGLVAFFGISITILMVNSALDDVYGLSTRKTVLLTPTVILVTIYVSKLLFTALVQRF